MKFTVDNFLQCEREWNVRLAEFIFKDDYLKSANLSALTSFVSVELIFQVCVFWLCPFSCFTYFQCQSVVLPLETGHVPNTTLL